jgi:phenylalanyl-tRNA synthetase beta chain
MKYSKKWIQEYLAAPLPSDDDIVEALTFYSMEVEDVEAADGDTVFDIKVLPNRAHDCLSHRGMARELSVLLGLPLNDKGIRVADAENALSAFPAAAELSLSIEDAQACRRCCLALVRGIKVGPSPAWLAEALASIGQRSINNVVDATNYVLFSLGQPIHAFDLGKMKGPAMRIRAAKEGERITLLSGEERELDGRVLVHEDSSGAVLDIAGVKGGAIAGIDESTTDIIIEAANFAPSAVRRAARGLQLLTDAAKRFENEIAPSAAPEALAAVANLITEIAGGQIVEALDTYPTPEPIHTVAVSLSRIESLLGIDLAAEAVEEIFARRGFAFERDASDAGRYVVTIPAERIDLRIEEDMIEEVGQLYGYHRLEPRVPTAMPVAPLSNKDKVIRALRVALSGAGFSEVYTYSFVEEGEIEVVNPIASNKAKLRASLRPQIGAALDRNLVNADLIGAPAITIFEIGTCFGAYDEKTVLCFGAKDSTKKQKDASAALERARTAVAVVLGTDAPAAENGVVEIVLDDAALPTIDDDAVAFAPVEIAPFSPISVYPYIVRDIALFADAEGLESEIAGVIAATAGPLLRTVRLFDRFAKEEDGVKRVSYGFRMAFQADDRTLVDDDATAAMEAVYAAVGARGWQVR